MMRAAAEAVKMPNSARSQAGHGAASISSTRSPFEIHPFIFLVLVAAALLARTYLRTAEELADPNLPSAQGATARRRTRNVAAAQTSSVDVKQRYADDESADEIGFLVSVHTRSRSGSSLGLDRGMHYSRDELSSAGWSEAQNRDDRDSTERGSLHQHGGCSFDEMSFRKIGGYKHTYGYGMAQSTLPRSNDAGSPMSPLSAAERSALVEAPLTTSMEEPALGVQAGHDSSGTISPTTRKLH